MRLVTYRKNTRREGYVESLALTQRNAKSVGFTTLPVQVQPPAPPHPISCAKSLLIYNPSANTTTGLATMFDYNKSGNKYLGMSFAAPSIGLGIIDERAVKMIAIAEKLARDIHKGKSIENHHANYLFAAFERLRGLYISAQRLFKELEAVPLKACGPPLMPPPYMASYMSTEAFLDFSTLLYHGASTLDILSKFYTSESEVKHTGKFRGSRNAIYNTQPPDIRADRLHNDLGLFEAATENIFTGDDGFKGLRNFIAHENSVLGLSAWAYSTHVLDHNTYLCFDCELVIRNKNDGRELYFPISRTAEIISSWVPWLVAKTALHYSAIGKHGTILANPRALPNWGADKFIPKWKNQFAIFSDHISEDENDPVFSTVRVTWEGCQTRQKSLKPEVLDFVVKPSPEDEPTE